MSEARGGHPIDCRGSSAAKARFARRPGRLRLAGGQKAVHVRTYALQSAPDDVVLQRARGEGRVLISADTDFGALLARQHADRPSVLLLRSATPRRAVDQARLILANLPAIEDDLMAGSVVILSDNRLRIRRLPLPPM